MFYMTNKKKFVFWRKLSGDLVADNFSAKTEYHAFLQSVTIILILEFPATKILMSAQEYLRMFLNTKIGKLFRLNQNLGQMSCINTQILLRR